MSRFRDYEDAALLNRIERLTRAETDLLQRLTTHIARVEVEGRWLRTDPHYQHLSSTLRSVRDELRNTKEEQLLRRASATREVA